MSSRYNICLLIDDNPLETFINAELIKMNNFAKEVVVSEHAEDALAMLKDGKIKPDIIFLDIRMPGMNGFQFLDEYDKLDIDKSHTEIIILSSSVNPADMKHAKRNKYVKGYFHKSLTPKILTKLASQA